MTDLETRLRTTFRRAAESENVGPLPLLAAKRAAPASPHDKVPASNGIATVGPYTVPLRPFDRRRRRLLPALAGVVIAACAAAFLVVVIGRPAPRPDAAAAGSSPFHYSFGVAPVAGFSFTSGSISPDVQQRDISTSAGTAIGVIEAGGAFLVEGEESLHDRRTITVAGHAAYLAEQTLRAPTSSSSAHSTRRWVSTVPVIAWQDKPDHWLVVRPSPTSSGPVSASVVTAWGSNVVTELQAIADAVRVGPASSMLLPFGFDRTAPRLAALTARSDTGKRTPSGSVILVEYGMEVTVNVTTAELGEPATRTATSVTVDSQQGQIDTSCSVQPAPSADPGADHGASHSDCYLMFRDGPWHIQIFVAGPGGGSRKVTSAQFLRIGEHLRLATSPSDTATWFDASALSE